MKSNVTQIYIKVCTSRREEADASGFSMDSASLRRRLRLFLLRCSGLILFIGLWTSYGAQNTNPVSDRTDYRNFEVIAKKNIFNPRRSPAYVPTERPQVRTRTETLALVGVMNYGKGPMAFFDGSRTDYKKVLKPNDKIAGFEVTAIDSSSVKLASSTNEMELRLGMQLSREQEGEWKLAMRPESLDTSYARATPMRSASQVNSDRAGEADQNNNNNPFAGIGNFFANGGFRGNGFSGGGFNNGNQNQPTQIQNQSSQPAVTPSAPESSDSILARLARQRQQETGEPQETRPEPSSDRGASPANPQNEPVRGSGTEPQLNQLQPNQPVGSPPNQ